MEISIERSSQHWFPGEVSNSELFDQEMDKLKSWQSHYDKLLNEEFPWNSESLSDETAIEGPPILFTEEIVSKAIKKRRPEKLLDPLVSSSCWLELPRMLSQPSCCTLQSCHTWRQSPKWLAPLIHHQLGRCDMPMTWLSLLLPSMSLK